MEIIPFFGFDGIRLGMTREQVRRKLGEPDSRSSEEDGDESWHYDGIGMSCNFWEDDDGRLGSMTFRSPTHLVSSAQIVGRAEEDLRALGVADVLAGLVLEDDMPGIDARNYECESLGLSFWVSNGIVRNMTLYPRYDATGERVLWPTESTDLTDTDKT
ncbi:MAG: hypothetical protein AAGF11_16720 [Myxococcota bacterium]